MDCIFIKAGFGAAEGTCGGPSDIFSLSDRRAAQYLVPVLVTLESKYHLKVHICVCHYVFQDGW